MKLWSRLIRMTGRVSLRTKLLSAFALVITLSLVPVAIIEKAEEASANALQRIVRVDNHVSDLALRGVATFLDARRHEKDFLLRYRELGFGEARARYAVQVQASVAELQEQLQALRELTADEPVREQTRRIDGAAAEYLSQFMQTVVLYEALALPRNGLRARLAAALEALQPPARIEPRFSGAYVDLYRAAYELLDDANPAEYRRVLEALTAVERAAGAGRTPRHRETFAARAGALRAAAAGILDATEAIAEHRAIYLEAAQRVEPLLETLHVERLKASEEAHVTLRAADQARERSALAAGLAAVLIAVTLAVFIALRTSRGVAALVTYTSEIAKGRLEAGTPEVSSRELRQLADALDLMARRLRESRDALAARNAELCNANAALEAEVSERKRREETLTDMNCALRALTESSQIAAAVIENSAEGVMVIDTALKIESVNPAFEKITGYPAAAIVGRSPKVLFSGRHDEAFFSRMHELVDERGTWRGEIWNRRANGELYPQETSINVLRDAQGRITHYASVFSDETERNQLETRLRELASLDGLTGIANRRTFDDVLESEWARGARDGRPLSLLMADIDYFKRYNDHYGHPAGDECLRRVAAAIAGAVSRAGDLAARYGGEEFVVILPNTDSAAAAEMGQKVRAAVAALALPHEASDAAPFVTISVGAATLQPLRTSGAADLTAAADRALYESKQSGRNRVVSAAIAERPKSTAPQVADAGA